MGQNARPPSRRKRGRTVRLRGLGWHSLGLEPAIFVAFAARAWQSLAGLATLFFIIRYLSAETQGYHQTFLSLLTIQTFVELGILTAIVSVSSHEWAGLSIGRDRRVEGDPARVARLAATTRFVASWFAGASLLFVLMAGGVGVAVLMQHGNPDIWALPWALAVLLGALFFLCQGLVAVIEGCNQVLPVATFRLVQSVSSIVVFWGALAAGAGLWALPLQIATSVACALLFLFAVYRRFLVGLLRDRRPSDFHWKKDIWPMQWPLALQGVGAFFWFSLFVPVMFSYHGPVPAGQMGLSLQVVMAMYALATSWVSVKVPRLGTMFAARDYSGYEAEWKRTALMSTLILFLGAVAVLALLWGARSAGLAEAARLLPPLPFLLLIGWAIVLQLIQCFAVYWRAQRVELLGFWGLLPGISTGLAVWLLGHRFGAVGAAAGAFAATALVAFPLCLHYFLQARRRVAELRGQAAAQSEATVPNA